jgi:hypothetical protein
MSPYPIKLAGPVLMISAKDTPNLHYYDSCGDRHIRVRPNKSLKRFAGKFERVTGLYFSQFDSLSKWESIVINCHGYGNGALALYDDINERNIDDFAGPMKGRVNDIWITACRGGAIRSVSKQAVANAPCAPTPASMLGVRVQHGVCDEAKWDIRYNRLLRDAIRRIHPPTLGYLLEYVSTYDDSLEDREKRRKITKEVWMDLNVPIPPSTHAPWLESFAAKLASKTGANVWASPHIQRAADAPLRRHTIDPFEGHLYKFEPDKKPLLISMRPTSAALTFINLRRMLAKHGFEPWQYPVSH